MVESSEQPLAQLLQNLTKTQKRLRLYEGTSLDWRRVEAPLLQELGELIDENGDLSLNIKESRILWRDEVVYESTDRNDSLSFLLFRDGIRHLSFQAGVTAEELHGFLGSLNEVRVVSNAEADLVTLFWEHDFQAIRYLAIDELPSATDGPRLEEQLASPTREGGGQGDAPSVSLADLQQPVSHLPMLSAQLTETDLRRLRAELSEEADEDFPITVAELAMELVLLSGSDAETEEVSTSLEEVALELVKGGQVAELLRLVEHLDGLQGLFADATSGRQLVADVLRSLAHPEQITAVLAGVSQERSVTPANLTEYLARLGADAAPLLVPWMGRMERPEARRAVSEAVALHLDRSLEALLEAVPAGQPVPAPLARELLHLVRKVPVQGAVRLIRRLVEVPDPEIRREAAVTLGALEGEEVEREGLRLLEHPDPEVGSLAQAALLRSNNRDLARPILDWALESEDFRLRSLEEKRRTFRTVARLGGEPAIDWLAELLRPSGRRWLLARSEKELERAAAYGILCVGTDRAQHVLGELAGSKDRFVRAACQEAIESGDHRK